MSAPAGWYPDPAGAPDQRWWDGAQWTAQLASYYRAPQQAKAPEGTSPYTPWIWFVLLLPMASVPMLFFIDWPGMMRAMLVPSAGPFAVYGAFGWAYWAFAAVSWLLTGAGIVFAWLDWRALAARGVPRPFHWAWSFFVFAGAGLFVYLIGRIVVVHRRTDGGLAVLWVLVATVVLGFVAGGVVSAQALSAFSEAFAGFVSQLPSR